MDQESLAIGNICGGSVDEVFQRELQHVLANIADVNTDPEAERKITLEFKMKPFKDRSGAQIEFGCKSKTVGLSVVKGTIFLQRRGANLVAVPHDPQQQRLFNSATDKKDVQ